MPAKVDLHELVDLVITTLDAKDPYTFEHSYRVADVSEMIAGQLGLSGQSTEIVHVAAHLHDIGKVGVSDVVLNKAGRLTASERLEMQSHSTIGFNILMRIPSLEQLSRIILHHHERLDGLGYPQGVDGNHIPLESRIIAVADAFDAITSHRPYRNAQPYEFGIEEIRRHSGTQFCPDCVAAFEKIFSRIAARLEKAAKGHHAFVGHEELMHSRMNPLDL